MEMYKNIIFMKYGRHAGENPEDIVKRKLEELKNCGKMYWGYNGNLTSPKGQVQPFSKEAEGKIYLLLSYTGSPFKNSSDLAEEFSIDKKNWQPLPKNAEIKGSTKAFVCKTFEQVKNLEINLSDYIGVKGESKNKVISDYLAECTRFDKVCATYKKGNGEKNMVKIDFICELDDETPAVYVR